MPPRREAMIFDVINEGRRVRTTPERLFIGGFTGRDSAAVAAHIAELAELGVTPPPSVPMIYEIPADLLVTDSHISVKGARTSGEVEPVYLRAGGTWYLGVGSDHTDRALEAQDIGMSKRACPKPVAAELLALSAGIGSGTLDGVLDRMTVSCQVDGRPYQHGTLAQLRPPGDLLSRVLPLLDTDSGADLAIFGGTVPVLGEMAVGGAHWSATLGSELGQLSLDYKVSEEAHG